jgi:hypothetical protein
VTGRLGFVAAAVVAVVAMSAAPAMADPARPTHYRSTVERLAPTVPGVTVTVEGGDAFLAVVVAPGTSLLVPGYQGEPYLAIDGDGVVSINRNSPASWLNTDRYGRAAEPPSSDPGAEPHWEVVAEGGEWAWHDHRIHWMSPDRPGPDEIDWQVPIIVDGAPVVVHGTLHWLPAQSPLPWLVVAAATLVAAVVLSRRGVVWSGVAVAAAGIAALVMSLAQAAASPPDAGGALTAQGAAAAATVGGVVTVVLGRRFPAIGDVPAAAGAAVLLIWGLPRLPALWLPVLPTPLPAAAERLVVAAVVGLSAGVLIGVLARRVVAIGTA